MAKKVANEKKVTVEMLCSATIPFRKGNKLFYHANKVYHVEPVIADFLIGGNYAVKSDMESRELCVVR